MFQPTMNRTACISFRLAVPDDLHTIASLRQKVWSTTYRGIYPDDMIDNFDFSGHKRKDLAKLHDPTFCVYLVCRNYQPVGYLIYQLFQQKLHLHSLNLISEARRQGIGRACLEHVRAYGHSHGLDHFHLRCNPWNTPAMAFYRSMGGVIVREDLENEERYMDAVWFRFSI